VKPPEVNWNGESSARRSQGREEEGGSREERRAPSVTNVAALPLLKGWSTVEEMSVQEWQGNIDKGKGKEKQTRRDTELDWIKVSSAFFFSSPSLLVSRLELTLFSRHTCS